jgi:hypothetical protein
VLLQLAHISSNQQQMPQGWNNVPSSAVTSAIPETPQTIQPSTNVPSEFGDNDGYSSSSSSSIHSPPKKSRGRPKGFKVSRSKNRNVALSQNFLQKAKRDIWNNRKRKKYYERFGRPATEEDATSIAVASIVSTPVEKVLEETFESVLENFKTALVENQEFLLPKCLHCEKMCDGQEALERHVKKFHNKELVAEECLNESTKLTEEQIPKEKGGPPKSIKRFECGSCFSDQGDLLRLIQHIFLLHFETKRHRCPFSFKKKCSDIKFHREGLNLHIRKVHPKEADTAVIVQN